MFADIIGDRTEYNMQKIRNKTKEANYISYSDQLASWLISVSDRLLIEV